MGQVRLANGHPDPGAAPGEGADDLGPDETGTTEDGDEIGHDDEAPGVWTGVPG